MKRTTYAIIEDEKPAVRLLQSMIEQLRPDYELVFLSDSVEKAVKWFGRNVHPDLIFLDIKLSDELSFEFLLRAQPLSAIVFTTAYNEYAVRAFDFNSVHYLLKPVEMKQLEVALQKYESSMSLHISDVALQSLITTLSVREPNYRQRYLIQQPHRFLSIPVDEIAYFYSENKVSNLVTLSGETYALDFSLQRIELEVSPRRFFRVNRKLLVGVDAIRKIEPYFGGRIVITMQPPFHETTVVSEDRVNEFKRWLGK